MRISHQEVFRAVVRNIATPYQEMLEDQIRVATGKRLNKPSDDPTGAERAIDIRSKLKAVEQYRKSIADARAWLSQAETELDRLEDLLTRAKELAIQGGNDTLTDADRDALAQEVNQLIEDIVSTANATYNGRYIFGGTATTVAPLVVQRDENGRIVGFSFQSNADAIRREVDVDEYVEIQLSAQQIFGGEDGPLSTLIDLRDALEENRPEAIRETIDRIDSALEQSLEKRAEIGARMSRLEHASQRLDDYELQLQTLQSQIEDADVAETLMDLAGHEMAYRAALAVGAELMGVSLLDYLG